VRDTRNAHEDELQRLSFDDRWDRWALHYVVFCVLCQLDCLCPTLAVLVLAATEVPFSAGVAANFWPWLL